MYREIVIRRLTVGSLFKLLFIGTVGFLLPFLIIMSVLASLGAGEVSWNGQQLHGFQGVIAGPFLAVITAAVSAAFGSVTLAAGLGLYSLFRPLRLVVRDEPES